MAATKAEFVTFRRTAYNARSYRFFCRTHFLNTVLKGTLQFVNGVTWT
jgi:hypothetical protein